MVPPQPNSAAIPPPACAACFVCSSKQRHYKTVTPECPVFRFFTFATFVDIVANSLLIVSYMSSEIQRALHFFIRFPRKAVQIDHRRSYDISQDLTWPHECLTATFQTFDSELCQ
jgi:hypothetical protein